MTTKRSYRNPLPIEVATQEIRHQAGTQFDPLLAGVFVKLIEKQQIQVEQGA